MPNVLYLVDNRILQFFTLCFYVNYISETNVIFKKNFPDGCLIDLNGPIVKPVPVAPLYPINSMPLGKSKNLSSIGRKSKGRIRAGSTKKELPFVGLPASWVPLLLPNPNQLESMKSDQYHHTVENVCNLTTKSTFLSWLQQLSESRVHRFIVSLIN